MSSTAEKVAEVWNKEAGSWQIGRGIFWTEHLAVRERMNLLASGKKNEDVYPRPLS
jgi:hypothetical protein